MKPRVKEILKNKSDKMVDLIVDDIGAEGEKDMSTSFVEKDVKYILKVIIKSGNPETITGFIDIEALPERVEEIQTRIDDLETRLITLEEKFLSNTLYDDTNIEQRLTALENALASETEQGSTEEQNENGNEL